MSIKQCAVVILVHVIQFLKCDDISICIVDIKIRRQPCFSRFEYRDKIYLRKIRVIHYRTFNHMTDHLYKMFILINL